MKSLIDFHLAVMEFLPGLPLSGVRDVECSESPSPANKIPPTSLLGGFTAAVTHNGDVFKQKGEKGRMIDHKSSLMN